MANGDDDKIKALYTAAQAKYSNLGTLEEFTEKMQNPEKRQVFFDFASKDFSLGTFEEFSEKVSVKKKEPTTPTNPFFQFGQQAGQQATQGSGASSASQSAGSTSGAAGTTSVPGGVPNDFGLFPGPTITGQQPSSDVNFLEGLTELPAQPQQAQDPGTRRLTDDEAQRIFDQSFEVTGEGPVVTSNPFGGPLPGAENITTFEEAQEFSRKRNPDLYDADGNYILPTQEDIDNANQGIFKPTAEQQRMSARKQAIDQLIDSKREEQISALRASLTEDDLKLMRETFEGNFFQRQALQAFPPEMREQMFQNFVNGKLEEKVGLKSAADYDAKKDKIRKANREVGMDNQRLFLSQMPADQANATELIGSSGTDNYVGRLETFGYTPEDYNSPIEFYNKIFLQMSNLQDDAGRNFLPGTREGSFFDREMFITTYTANDLAFEKVINDYLAFNQDMNNSSEVSRIKKYYNTERAAEKMRGESRSPQSIEDYHVNRFDIGTKAFEHQFRLLNSDFLANHMAENDEGFIVATGQRDNPGDVFAGDKDFQEAFNLERLGLAESYLSLLYNDFYKAASMRLGLMKERQEKADKRFEDNPAMETLRQVSVSMAEGRVASVSNMLENIGVDMPFDPDDVRGSISHGLGVPKKLQEPAIKDGSINWYPLARNVLEGYLTFTLDLAAVDRISNGIRALGVGKKTSDVVSFIAADYAFRNKDYHDIAVQAGLDGDQANSYAVGMSVFMGLIETVAPNNLIRGEANGVLQSTVVKSLSEGLTMGDAFREGLKAVGKEIGKENLEEQLALLGESLLNASVNQMTGSDLETDITGDEILETFLVTTAITAPPASISARRSKDELRMMSNYQAALDPKKVEEQANKMLENKQITREQATAAIQKANKNKKILDAMPEDMSESDKAEFLDNVSRKEAIEQDETDSDIPEELKILSADANAASKAEIEAQNKKILSRKKSDVEQMAKDEAEQLGVTPQSEQGTANVTVDDSGEVEFKVNDKFFSAEETMNLLNDPNFVEKVRSGEVTLDVKNPTTEVNEVLRSLELTTPEAPPKPKTDIRDGQETTQIPQEDTETGQRDQEPVDVPDQTEEVSAVLEGRDPIDIAIESLEQDLDFERTSEFGTPENAALIEEQLNNLRADRETRQAERPQARRPDPEGAPQEPPAQQTPKKSVENVKKDKFKAAADFLRSKKFVQSFDDMSSLKSDPTGLFKAAIDGSLEAAALVMETSGKVSDAISAGINNLRETDWYKNLSENGRNAAEKMFEGNFRMRVDEQRDEFESGQVASQASLDAIIDSVTDESKVSKDQLRQHADEHSATGISLEEHMQIMADRINEGADFDEAHQAALDAEQEAVQVAEASVTPAPEQPAPEQPVDEDAEQPEPETPEESAAQTVGKRFAKKSIEDEAARKEFLKRVKKKKKRTQKEVLDDAREVVNQIGEQSTLEFVEEHSADLDPEDKAALYNAAAETAFKESRDKRLSEEKQNEAYTRWLDYQVKLSEQAEKSGRGGAIYSEIYDQNPDVYSRAVSLVARTLADKRQKLNKQQTKGKTNGDVVEDIRKEIEKEVRAALANDMEVLKKKNKSLERQINRLESEQSTKTRKKKEQARKQISDGLKEFKDAFFGRTGEAQAAVIPGLNQKTIEAIGKIVSGYIKLGGLTAKQIVNKVFDDIKSIGATVSKSDIDKVAAENQTYSKMKAAGAEVTVEDIEGVAGKSINQVVKEHYTNKQQIGKTLAQELVDKAGLSDAEAKSVSKKIEEAVADIISKRTQSALERRLKPREETPKAEKERKREDRKTINQVTAMVNMGALSTPHFSDAFADKFDFSAIDPATQKRILELVDQIQAFSQTEREGDEGVNVRQSEKKLEAEKELNTLIDSIENKKTAFNISRLITEVVYTHVLTGFNTQVNANVGAMATSIINLASKIGGNITRPAALIYAAGKAFAPVNVKASLSRAKRAFDTNTTIYDSVNTINEGSSTNTQGRYERQVLKGVAKAARKIVTDPTLAGKGKATLETMFQTFIQASRMTFLLKASDAFLTNQYTEFVNAIDAYNQVAKETGATRVEQFFGNRKLMRSIDRALAYDKKKEFERIAQREIDSTINSIYAEVDAEIAAGDLPASKRNFEIRKRKKQRVSRGYKSRRVKELLENNRDTETFERSLNSVRDWVMLNDPDGIAGRAVDWYKRNSAIKKDDSTLKIAAKTLIGLTIMFPRMTGNFFNAIKTGTPVIGMMDAAIGWGRVQGQDVDKLRLLEPGALGRLFTSKYKANPELFKRRMIVNGLTTAATYLAFAAMFEWDDEEEQWTLREDRPFDIRGNGSGNYAKNQLIDMNFNSFSISFEKDENGNWTNYRNTNLAPQVMPIMAMLGGLSDDVKGFQDEEGEERARSRTGFIGRGLQLSTETFFEGSFVSLARHAKTVMREDDIADGLALMLMDVSSSPAKNMVQPNFYRDIITEIQVMNGANRKQIMAKGLSWDTFVQKMAYDFYGLDYWLDDKTDMFGNPYPKVSKFTQWMDGYYGTHVKDTPELNLLYKFETGLNVRKYKSPKDLSWNGLTMPLSNDERLELESIQQKEWKSLMTNKAEGKQSLVEILSDMDDPQVVEDIYNKTKQASIEIAKQKFLIKDGRIDKLKIKQ